MYVTPTKNRTTYRAVLYLTDAFGLPLIENKLWVAHPSVSCQQADTTTSRLADSFARAGYLTVMPDIFSGDPAPHDITFNSSEFLARHTTNATDPIVATTIGYMRQNLGVKVLDRKSVV